MGIDPNERTRLNGTQKKATKKIVSSGCFISLAPTEAQRKMASALASNSTELNHLLALVLDEGLVLGGRWDEKNAACMLTLTKKAENWEDNQTIGAFHREPCKALALALIAYRDQYQGVASWKKDQPHLEFDW